MIRPQSAFGTVLPLLVGLIVIGAYKICKVGSFPAAAISQEAEVDPAKAASQITILNRCAAGESYTLIAPYLRRASTKRSPTKFKDMFTIRSHWDEPFHTFIGLFRSGKLLSAREEVIMKDQHGRTFFALAVDKSDPHAPATLHTLTGQMPSKSDTAKLAP